MRSGRRRRVRRQVNSRISTLIDKENIWRICNIEEDERHRKRDRMRGPAIHQIRRSNKIYKSIKTYKEGGTPKLFNRASCKECI